MSESPISCQFENAIGVIVIDNPPVNALSQAVRAGLLSAIEACEANRDCRAVVLLCAGRTFVAGADVREFGQPPSEPYLPDLLNRIEACSKPVVVALHGTALGGGFELALAGHYRIALESAKVGLPEVKLGLIPGAGGTQRLPRAAGFNTALQMATSGVPSAVAALLECGAIDRVVSGDAQTLRAAALSYADELIAAGAVVRPLSAQTVAVSGDEQQLIAASRAALGKRARGQQAPLAALQSVANSLTMSFAEGLAAERELFLSCRSSPQSRAMRHAFFAERAVSKVSAAAAAKPQAVTKVGVIGAGTMGSGIAMCFASAGIDVVLLELSAENLQRGLATIADRYADAVAKGRLTEAGRSTALSKVSGSCDYSDFADVDLVVEAAFESMAVKRDIFAKLDQVCKPSAILATNTSYLDVDEIAAVTQRPAQVVGMHFFSPAHVMKLLEVVNAAQTSAEALATAMAVGKQIGKIAVAVGVCYGFVGNRMYSAYGREANRLLLEGATPEQIDSAMTEWGMAMGPLSVADLSGIDIGYKARSERQPPIDDPLYFLPANRLAEAGLLGQKTGSGFYHYGDGGKQPNPQALQLVRAAATEQAVPQRSYSAEQISQRLLAALVNEGCRILEEGIAERASDIDVIWLNGYGFPRYRGGPMCWADEVGLDAVLATVEACAAEPGDRYWVPAKLLQTLVAQGATLADYQNH